MKLLRKESEFVKSYLMIHEYAIEIQETDVNMSHYQKQ